ncbi:hypothetical protein CEP51_016431 [Fusarium floridanum]|uniref:Uncharacterized protein n=2 Tax=Fusarium solani species complex TaxID=232080 RepID=A0A428NQ13_9HYPO|nr:hypothetical protein CEP51_016431 [Fusarium floridanum]
MDSSIIPPDFDAIADSYGVLAEQFQRVGNLPAIDSGQNVIEEVRRLGAQVQEGRREQREMLGRIETALQGLSRDSTVSNRNVVLRSENSVVSHVDTPLRALWSYETGSVIRRFPRTVGVLRQLPETALDRLLAELRCDIEGTVDEKRRRLMLACGVVSQAVRRRDDDCGLTTRVTLPEAQRTESFNSTERSEVHDESTERETKELLRTRQHLTLFISRLNESWRYPHVDTTGGSNLAYTTNASDRGLALSACTIAGFTRVIRSGRVRTVPEARGHKGTIDSGRRSARGGKSGPHLRP